MGYRQTDRNNIVCSSIRVAIDDAHRYMRMAFASAFTYNDIDDAVDECLQAINAINEAGEHSVVFSDEISTQQQSKFDKEREALDRCLWALTKEISKKTRSCYTDHRKTRVLRRHFLIWSWEPEYDLIAPEARLADLYF